MPVSDPQKHGVTALGCRFSDKAVHVPLKKRRFMFRSPSPPPVIASPTAKGVELSKSEESNLSLNIDNNISICAEKSDEKIDKDEDFSGISILASAACSSSVGIEHGYAERGTVVDESSVLYRGCELSTNIKAPSFSKDLVKEERLSSSEMSTGGTLSCISVEPVGELPSKSTPVYSPPEVVADGKCIKGIPLVSDSLPSSGKASCSKNEDMVGSQRSSSRDVKVHWDLNVAWEEQSTDDAHNPVLRYISQDAMNDNLGPKPSSDQASSCLKSKQDETVSYNVNQQLGEKSVEFNTNSNLDVVKCIGVSSGLDTLRDVTQNAALSEDSKVHKVSSIQGENLDQDSAIKMDFSEIPPMTTKESCDPRSGELSNTDLINHTKNSVRDDDVEGADFNNNATVRRDAMGEGSVQDDYDSQYEDGELREPTECPWEEYNDVDRESEYVDYGSDNISPCITNHSDYQDSESGQVEGSKNGRQALSSFGDCYVDNQVCGQAAIAVESDKDNKVNQSFSDVDKMELPRGIERRESNKNSDIADEDGRKGSLPPYNDDLVDSRGTVRTEEPNVFRRPMQSRIEGPIGRAGPSRDVRPYRIENRFESGHTRSFERGRYSYHNQGRGRHNGTSHYGRGCNRHYSPINNRRSKLGDDAVMERDATGCDGSRDDPSFSRQHANRPDRKFSPDRGAGFGRGRPFRYGPSNDNNRDGRGRYNAPSPNESFQSSLKYRRPVSCRERSVSPFGGRGQANINHTRGKSPSRSRSRSPIMWDSHRERPGGGRGGHTFIRNRDRSPNLRSDVRMQRSRSPNQQSGFGSGHSPGFRSINRNHSPPRNKWNAGSNDESEKFGEYSYKQRNASLDRSPGRFHSRGNRDNNIDSPQNRNPDGYSKFSNRVPEDGAGRGIRYGDSYNERRTPNNFLRPARRSYEDGMGSILQHDRDDDFSNTNNSRNRDGTRFSSRGGFRGTDGRIGDMRRNFRGDRQNFGYERDGKFNSNSREFTADMNGGNQRPHYEKYENRGKQFSSTNFMRHNENKGMDARSTRNAEENFQYAQNFCASHERGFEPRVGIAVTRSREDGDIAASEREAKNNNSQVADVKNSENDAIMESVAS